jgi:alkylation response protein AidB-like acyl-CoA dehydrogenase
VEPQPSTVTLPQCEAAEALERQLGDPRLPTHPFSFRQAVEADEREAFPAEPFRLCVQAGLQAHFVPADCGGRLSAIDETMLLVRLIARRDLSVAIALAKSLLGSMPVWLAGSPAQRAAMKALLDAGGSVSLALTEEAHGSDLMATDVRAAVVPGGYALSGEKWLINNATRGQALSVLARVTGGRADGAVAVFFVEKARLAPGSFSPLPKNRTLGIRGADISGIAFHDCVVPAEAMIGRPSDGLPLVLKLLQVTRTGCTALSLGAADTALRATIDFALQRRLYRTTMIDLPYPRRALVEAFADVLTAECVSMAAARTLHTCPGQMTLTSAVAKYFVPATIEAVVDSLASTLGARYYVRTGFWDGIFQKVLRDNRLVGLFDGNSAVNLMAIVGELVPRAQRMASGVAGAERLEATFALAAPLPPLDFTRLALTNRGIEDVVDVLPLLPQRVQALAARGEVDAASAGALLARLDTLVVALHRQNRQVAAADWVRSLHKPPEAFDAAKRYCLFFAAAACVLTWLYNRDTLGPFAASPQWLLVCLTRLVRQLQPLEAGYEPAWVEAMEGEMLAAHRENRLFSLLRLALADAEPCPS